MCSLCSWCIVGMVVVLSVFGVYDWRVIVVATAVLCVVLVYSLCYAYCMCMVGCNMYIMRLLCVVVGV